MARVPIDNEPGFTKFVTENMDFDNPGIPMLPPEHIGSSQAPLLVDIVEKENGTRFYRVRILGDERATLHKYPKGNWWFVIMDRQIVRMDGLSIAHRFLSKGAALRWVVNNAA